MPPLSNAATSKFGSDGANLTSLTLEFNLIVEMGSFTFSKSYIIRIIKKRKHIIIIKFLYRKMLHI